MDLGLARLCDYGSEVFWWNPAKHQPDPSLEICFVWLYDTYEGWLTDYTSLLHLQYTVTKGTLKSLGWCKFEQNEMIFAPDTFNYAWCKVPIVSKKLFHFFWMLKLNVYNAGKQEICTLFQEERLAFRILRLGEILNICHVYHLNTQFYKYLLKKRCVCVCFLRLMFRCLIYALI
jgi:hypothetical protein